MWRFEKMDEKLSVFGKKKSNLNLFLKMFVCVINFYLPGRGDCGANPRSDSGGVSGAQSRGNLGSPY
jgi:hypothetical protein